MNYTRLLAGMLMVGLLSAAGLHVIAGAALFHEDDSPSRSHVLLENWSGDADQFKAAMNVAGPSNGSVFCTFMFAHLYENPIEKARFVHAATLAGIDTTQLRLIPVPYRNPRTLHIAQAVLDSSLAWRWDTLLVVTARLHTARSHAVYQHIGRQKGIVVQVLGAPYMGITERNWFESWEGIETVLEESVKMLYYRLSVL